MPHKPKKPRKRKKRKKKDPPMADWFAGYRESDGELVSLGTVIADPLAPGLAKKLQPGPSKTRTTWNTTTLQFVDKPPHPADVDRVDEFMDTLSFRLGNSRDAEIRVLLARMLANLQFRDAIHETFEIER